jgi:hypothetical protein
MLAAIFYYQTMILITTIAHISHCLQYKLHFFYVEDLVHFLIFSEMMIFCANFITNVLVLFVASVVDIKNVKPNQKDKMVELAKKDIDENTEND